MNDKKFIESYNTDDWEVMTDTGWQDVSKIHKTIPYEIWEIKTENYSLKCADKHLVFNKNMFPTYVDELQIGDEIWTENGLEKIIYISKNNEEENMYDLELEDSNHRYYTNGILSHNTITSAVYILWVAMAFPNQQILITAQDTRAATENLGKIKGIYEYCPDFLKKGLVSDNKSTLVFDNGSRIVVRPSTIKAPRGISPTIVYCDEFAFIGAQDSADKALEKQQEFFGALSPTLSATKGKLFITSTPMSETDLFYQLWQGAIKKVYDNGLDMPNDYIIKLDGELYRDFHLFHNKEEAVDYANTLKNDYKEVEVVEKLPAGNNGYQSQLVKWDACPFKDVEWAKAEVKKVGESKFAREYNCLSGENMIYIMDEKGYIRNITIQDFYNHY